MPGAGLFFQQLGKGFQGAAAGENSNGFAPIKDLPNQAQPNVGLNPQPVQQANPAIPNAPQQQMNLSQLGNRAENRADIAAQQAGGFVAPQPNVSSGAGGLGAAIANLHAANAIASAQPGVAQSMQADAPQRQPEAESARQEGDLQSDMQTATDQQNAPYPIVSSYNYNDYGI